MENQEVLQKPRRNKQNNPPPTRTPRPQPCLPGCLNRSRRHRWFRKVHATLFIETLARNRWLSSPLHGVEFFAAREIRHTPRKTTPPPHPHHIFSLARRRFCGPLRTPDHASATRRLSSARRPLYLYSFRA